MSVRQWCFVVVGSTVLASSLAAQDRDYRAELCGGGAPAAFVNAVAGQVDAAQAAGVPSRIEFVPMPEEIRPNYQYFTEARMEKLRRAGYVKESTPLEEGVRQYVAGYLSQPDRYR